MDKLKPVLTHKFWILFVIALGLSFFGWSGGASNVDETNKSGVSKLDGSLKKIKDLGGTAATKNSDWIEKLDAINTEMSSRTSVAAAQLWDSQKSLKRWPVRIGQRAPNFFCLEDVTTLEQSLGGKSNMLRTFYRLDFQRELERVWLLAQPEGAAQGPQKVRFPLQDMPTPSRFPWESVDPSIEEIYSAQEDLWLISSLLMAVREVNSGTVSVIDSHVKELQLVQLFRGTRLADGAAGGGGAGGAGGGAGGAMGGAGGGAGGAMGGAGGGGPMGGGGGPMGGGGGPMGGGGGPMGGGGGPMGGSGGAAASEGGSLDPQKYYCEDTEFRRTRGFKMKLVVDHRKLPELLAALSRSPWPVEIIHVNQGPAPTTLYSPAEGTTEGGSEGGGIGPMGGGGTPMGGGGTPMGGGGTPMGGGGGAASVGLQAPGGGAVPMGGGGGGFAGPGPGFGGGGFQSSLGDNSATDDQVIANVVPTENPHLATVVIVGLMTIYKKPPVNESAAAANPGTPAANPKTPAANPGTPAANPNAPAGKPGTPESNQKPQPGANPGR